MALLWTSRAARVAAVAAGLLAVPRPATAQQEEAEPPPEPPPAGADAVSEPAPVDVEALEAGTAAGAGEVDPKYAPVLQQQPDGTPTLAPPAGGLPAVGPLGNLLGSIELHWSGSVSASVHARVEDKSVGGIFDRVAQPVGISRYETTFNLQLDASTGPFRGIADVDLDLLGYGDERGVPFANLSRRQDLFTARVEVHALYLEGRDLLLDGLDLRIGEQLVQWGVADQFNPTNTLNPEDLENVLRFGQQAANLMARVDYAFLDTWTVTGVFVPVFKPAILPRSARAGAVAVDRIPYLDEPTRLWLHAEREFAASIDSPAPGAGNPTMVSNLDVKLPPFDARSFGYGLRVAGDFFGQDLGLSWTLGRTDIPVPIRQDVTQLLTPDCAAAGVRLPGREAPIFVPPDTCPESLLLTDVTLAYPQVQVIGLNVAGELPVIPIGYRFELGINLPQRRRGRVVQDDLLILFPVPAGEHAYVTPDGGRPIVVDDTPFAKWTLGLDYTFTSWLYGNVMWVHGFADEFGAGDWISPGSVVRAAGAVDDDVGPLSFCALDHDGTACSEEVLRNRLGDYLVLGFDFKFADDQALVRLFTIFDLTGYELHTFDATAGQRVVQRFSPFSEEGFSAVLYPEVGYTFGGGLQVGAGALIQLGRDYTKFGDPAAGGSLVFVHGRYAF